MKSTRVLAVSVVLLTWTALVFAEQQAGKEGAEKELDPTHKELRALREGVLEAVNKKDVDALIQYLHPDIVLTVQDGKELRVIRKHDGVRDYFTRMLTGPQPEIKHLQAAVEVDELTILHGDDTGIAFGSSRDHYVLASGSEFDLPTRWSATLVKEDGKWLIACLQFSTNPFNNPLVTGLERMMYWVGGIAGGAGVLLGLLLGRLILGRGTRTADV